nr:hypothetical protein [Tanacetum cinerariifolium]
GLGDIVSINQSAFAPGRRISDNILLTQELMRNYHRRRGPPRCAFKVDIQKAYDTVDLKFLETILMGFGFHPKMGKRGLRQGDPLSPYLFTLVMKVLTLMLQHELFLFARGHPSLVSVIMDVLEEFKHVSSLVPSIPKSAAFFCNVPNAIKASILNYMPLAEGALLVRYLGVPFISTRLIYRDYKILVEKLESRVNDWINKFLSLTGRLQLIRAAYAWFSLVPKGNEETERLKLPGIQFACLSMRVKWIHTYKLNGHSFWDVPCRDVCLLKDMLSNRDITRSSFSLDDSVSNLISDGFWRWPPDWLSRFPSMAQLQVLILLDDMDDVILWRDRDGVLRSFSMACVWDTIRSRADVVRAICGMDSISPRLADVMAFIVPISKSKTVISTLSRIVVAASSYYIWLERNKRLFKRKSSSPDQIIQVILSMVRLKLVTFKFKKMSTRSLLLLDQWKIPSYCIAYDGSSK